MLRVSEPRIEPSCVATTNSTGCTHVLLKNRFCMYICSPAWVSDRLKIAADLDKRGTRFVLAVAVPAGSGHVLRPVIRPLTSRNVQVGLSTSTSSGRMEKALVLKGY